MIKLEDCVIVSGVRIPIGKFGGALKDLKVYDIGGEAIKAAVEKAGITPDMVDEVIMNDPIIRRLVAIQVAREMGMEDQYLALETQLGQLEEGLSSRPKTGSEGGPPRGGDVRTATGREQTDMSLSESVG